MPVQTYQSTLAKRLGARITQAHQQTKDNPVNEGVIEMPGDVNFGIARLRGCKIDAYKPDVKSEHLRGQEFFLADAIALSPQSVTYKDGTVHRVAGLRTTYETFPIPLCDEPAFGDREARTLAQNWGVFQNFFQLFGIDPPGIVISETASEAEKVAASNQLVAYYQAAMKTLNERKPTFNFSTRLWIPKPKPSLPGQKPQPAKAPRVYHTWHKECAPLNGAMDPSAGVTVSAEALQPAPFTEPPMGVVETPTAGNNGQPADTADPSDEIIALVEVVMADPNRLTEAISDDAAQAASRLTELAKAAGATDDQIAAAPDYDVIGQMALGVFDAPTPAATITPTVGQKAKFCKRDSKGNKLANAKKEPFPPQEIEVVTVDAANKTVTAKDKTGKPVVDLKKNVIQIKWEWLE